ncbi:MAG: DUF2110 family protein [Candidatus Bathyarchaeia archaeon]
MTRYVILQKLYGVRKKACADALAKYLRTQASELEVAVSLIGETKRGWAIVDIAGSDERVFAKYIGRKIGIAPTTFEELKPGIILRGKAVDVGKVGYGLFVDVGLDEYIDAFISLYTLRRQLADGARVSARTILRTYCIVENFPMSIRLIKTDKASGEMEAELSDQQISMFENWYTNGFERVLAFGISAADIDEALKKTGLKRYVVRLEQLGLFEHSILCKHGTEAPGIIARLGEKLPGIPLSAFSPSKAKALSGSPKINTTS